MTHSTLRCCLLALALLLGWSSLATAQSHVVLVSPLGLPDGRIDAEFNECVTDGWGLSCDLRLGIRVTSATVRTSPEVRTTPRQTLRYQDVDLLVRLGSRRSSAQGWLLGLRAGATFVPKRTPSLGLGFDVDRHWLLGSRLIVGGGVGVKGVFGADDDLRLDAIPAMRLSAGFAF